MIWGSRSLTRGRQDSTRRAIARETSWIFASASVPPGLGGAHDTVLEVVIEKAQGGDWGFFDVSGLTRLA